MDFKKMKSYLAPKYRAADGGELPDEDNDYVTPEQLPDESIPDDTLVDEPEEKATPDPVDEGVPEAPPGGARDPAKLKEYLQSQYDTAGNTDNIKAARSTADSKNMIANIGDALGSIVSAGGVGHGMAKDDGSFYKGMKDQNNQKVSDAVADRKASLDSWTQKLAVDDHVAKQMVERGTADQKAAALKILQDNNNGESGTSKQKLALFNQFHPDHALPDGTSGVTIDAAAKMAASGDTNALKKLLLEAKVESAKSGTSARQEGLDLRATNTAQSLIDKNQTLKNGFNRMDKVNSAKGLMGKIQSGELTDTESVASQLTNMVSSIEMGGAGGVGDREHTAVKGLQMQISKLSNYFGKPASAIPPEVLGQINNEINTLGEETAKNMRGAHKSLVAGTQNKTQQDAINNRMNTYFNENGYGDIGTQNESRQQAAQAPAAPAAPQLVRMQAPDGSSMSVPKSSIDKYLKKGAKVVQ